LCGGSRLVGTADLYLLHKLSGLLGWQTRVSRRPGVYVVSTKVICSK
jgi:hypothetical protein